MQPLSMRNHPAGIQLLAAIGSRMTLALLPGALSLPQPMALHLSGKSCSRAVACGL